MTAANGTSALSGRVSDVGSGQNDEFKGASNVHEDHEIEHDTVAWFRIGLVLTSLVVGLFVFVLGPRAVAYFFLGYAVFAAIAMYLFKSWRSSTEIDKSNKIQRARMIRNIPRGFMRYTLAMISCIAVMAVGVISVFFVVGDDQNHGPEYWTTFGYLLSAVGLIVFIWVGGVVNTVRQLFDDIKALQDAARRTKERRARMKKDSLRG